ncbi:MAG TPA: sn-glycerol-3-phosphate ABC transporter ATP-binding protein UgpC [Gaiellaceae bacterium]|nr:sn-glycerol-3-phosphate ABC transporter ATP-binding protein UgpC [Gaiellaceae bacterium]
MAEIEFVDVSKVYGDGTQAVFDLDLKIEDGELMVLVGPSGCGKTTALRMVAGLEEITAGDIRIGDRIVNDLTPKERNIAMVFQSYALYPHMTVEENLAFSLKLHHMPKTEIKRRVQDAAKTLEIEQFLKRKPKALSGGQRQRVAMGRAIVREPDAFLMDEPLSNLDAKLRVQMRAEIHQLQRRLNTTTIYVTHDQVEAMTMGDRVAVMNAGRLLQVDTPQVLYDKPSNEFVAGFIGSPAINLVEAQLERENGRYSVAFGEYRLAVDDSVARNRPRLKEYVGKPIILGVRPEDFEDASLESGAPSDRRMKVEVDLTEPLGADVLLYFGTSATGVVSSAATADVGEDAAVHLGGNGDGVGKMRMCARVSPRTHIAIGHSAELVVDTSRLYFFDPEAREAVV